MLFALLSALLLQPAASPAPAACAAQDQDLPANLRSWNDHVDVPGVQIGGAGDVATNRPLPFVVSEAGTYAVAVSLGAWIDVARDGQVLRSVAHDHGPACSTIRKIVDFRLEPGTYTITLSRTEASSARLLIFRR
jgi:hypothetical protein